MARSDKPSGGELTSRGSIVRMTSKFSKFFPSLSENPVSWQPCDLVVHVEGKTMSLE